MESTAATVIVIPARLESARLPGKPLLRETGKPLILHTLDAARQSQEAAAVIVATDSRRIASTVRRYAGDASVVPTSASHRNGTSRTREAYRRLCERAGDDPNALLHVIVNWQCDEPDVSAADVDRLVCFVRGRGQGWNGAATLVSPLADSDRNCRDTVKAAVCESGRCLFFSRGDIDGGMQHIGVYAFSGEFMEMEPCLTAGSKLAEAASLEQLEWLENGFAIHAIQTQRSTRGINSPQDYREFVANRLESAQ